MKRLVLIVEGETEQGFVSGLLRPYMHASGIYNDIQCFKIKHSKGGMSKYRHIKVDIVNTLHESDAVVTTMVDFYRLPSDFPGFASQVPYSTHLARVEMLERAWEDDVLQSVGRVSGSFIPYIQLHEFEALVFSSLTGFEEVFDRGEMNYKGLSEIVSGYPNPEDIDDGPDTAPSMRLKALIPGYNKVLYGVGILKVTGMDTLLYKCPHFRAWVEKLKQAIKE